MTIVANHIDEGLVERANETETESGREMRRLAEAKTIAGPEHADGTDRSEILIADGRGSEATPEDIEEAIPETEPLIDVGDHVQDKQDPDATMLVVNLDTLRADAYELKDGLTVADNNPEYPADDDVVEVVYPNRTDLSLEDKKSYAYHKSRLEVVARVHDRDGGEDADSDGDGWVEDDHGNRVPKRSEPADFGGGESTGVQDL